MYPAFISRRVLLKCSGAPLYQCVGMWLHRRRGMATTPDVPSAGLLHELQQRELVRDCTDERSLQNLINSCQNRTKGGGPLPAAYLGIDPTASSLHIGHLVGIKLLMRLREAGMRIIVIIGGVTAVVGDPSGKTGERAALPLTQVENNAESLERMVHSIINSDSVRQGCDAALVLNNREWLEGLNVGALLTGAGRHMRLGAMLSKDNVRARLQADSAGMSFAEFAYPVLQGCDWVHLAKHYNCHVQVGGSDQWGNLVDGANLVKRMLLDSSTTASGQNAETPIVGLTCPLLLDSSGSKLGKSTGGGSTWLDPQLTSPFELYQFFRRLDVTTAATLLRQLTHIPLDEIHELVQMQNTAPEKAEASQRLASEITTWIHGVDATNAASAATTALFSRAAADHGDMKQQQVKTIVEAVAAGGASEVILQREAVIGQPLVDVCVAAGLCSSKGAARRLLAGGGLSMNQKRCSSPPKGSSPLIVQEADILYVGSSTDTFGVLLLKSGKKTHVIVRVQV